MKLPTKVWVLQILNKREIFINIELRAQKAQYRSQGFFFQFLICAYQTVKKEAFGTGLKEASYIFIKKTGIENHILNILLLYIGKLLLFSCIINGYAVQDVCFRKPKCSISGCYVAFSQIWL